MFWTAGARGWSPWTRPLVYFAERTVAPRLRTLAGWLHLTRVRLVIKPTWFKFNHPILKDSCIHSSSRTGKGATTDRGRGESPIRM